MGTLDGKVALVTGASRGIGRAIAVELARAGAKVGLNHHPSMDKAEVDAAAQAVETAGGEWLHVFADVSVGPEARQAVQRVASECGRLDILVNNAGITRDRSLKKMSDQEWEDVIRVNLNSVFYCTSAAIPVMVQQGYGRIVSISSVIAQTGAFGQANYAAAKAGIIGFTRTAALELARNGITVNAVCPGFTDTPMVAAMPAPVLEQATAKVPLARLAQPEEIAQAVLFLVSPAASFITGHQLNVNGGLYF